MNIKLKVFDEFSAFLEKIKDILSNCELGKAYVELASYSPDFKSAYKYYNIANNYLKEDFETKKLNLNKIIEFSNSLIEKGDISILDKFKIIKKSFVNFYKLYYNFKENDIDTFVEINKEQKMKDLILQQNELIENIYLEKHFQFK